MEIWELLPWIAGIIACIVAVPLLSLYTVKEWEKAIILRFGKIIRVSEAGIHTRIPFADSARYIDMRTQTIDLKSQVAITKDNISVGVDAVVFMRVENPKILVLNVQDEYEAVSKYSQTTMRDLIGTYELNELLANRAQIAETVKKNVDEVTTRWGIDITNVEIQDISLPEDMKRAFAVQAEAKREAEAIQTKARAELEAADDYQEAASKLAGNNAMQLRILETIKQVSKDQSNTIIFALPTETLTKMGISGIAAAASINSSDSRRRKAQTLELQKKPIELPKEETKKESDEEDGSDDAEESDEDT